MIDHIFQKFFSVGHVSIGPTIVSPHLDGSWLGSVQIYSTTKDIFLEKKYTCVGIREFNNSITEEFYNALNYLSIDKVRFDYFINNVYLMEWENCEGKIKPDISVFKKRAYIFSDKF